MTSCAQSKAMAVHEARTLSMMETSMVLMVTGGSLMPRTQEPSQGAGQTRPVNSGKLFVSSSRYSASFHRPWYTSAFHSGILLPSGHPASTPTLLAKLLCSANSDEG